MSTTDSDIPAPREHPEPAPEITRVFEIRTKLVDERPRFWNGSDFAIKNEEVKQYESYADAVLVLSGLRAGAYIVEVGL